VIASEVQKRPISREEVECRRQPDHTAVTAPSPAFRSTTKSSSNWIECDVAVELEKVCIALDQKRVISALKHMPAFAVSTIELLCEIAVQPPHTSSEVSVGCSDHEVVVRRHETEGEARPIVAHYDVPERLEEVRTIIVVAKERLFSDAAARDVVRGPWELKTGRPRHTDEAKVAALCLARPS
jgi:hypothetical protein